jgi:chorismate-pyruvate lyase
MPDGAGPELEKLLALFPPADYVRAYEEVQADAVPLPYRQLLVHEHHMTVTVESHHGERVNVLPVAVHRTDGIYARISLLSLKSNGRIVQFGIMRINFHYCDDAVRAEILAEKTPLGRILIEHDVLRRIEPTAFLRIDPGSRMKQCFGLDEPWTTYGRLAIIHCNGQPAVELLEIVRPES